MRASGGTWCSEAVWKTVGDVWTREVFQGVKVEDLGIEGIYMEDSIGEEVAILCGKEKETSSGGRGA